MSDAYDCPHGMGKATSCVDCMDEGPVAPPRKQVRLTAGVYIDAQFASRCPGCNQQIAAGDRIGSTDIGWCCTACCRTS